MFSLELNMHVVLETLSSEYSGFPVRPGYLPEPFKMHSSPRSLETFWLHFVEESAWQNSTFFMRYVEADSDLVCTLYSPIDLDCLICLLGAVSIWHS